MNGESEVNGDKYIMEKIRSNLHTVTSMSQCEKEVSGGTGDLR